LWIDLQKVNKDSISLTSIRHAKYELAWVQKSNDAKKEFVMLPFRYFESDTSFIEDKLLRDAFDVFRKDARALYAKHNVNVSEKINKESLDSLHYSIRLDSFSDDLTNLIANNVVLQSYGLEKVTYGADQWYWLIGKFLNRKDAELALADIQTRTEFKDIRIVRRIGAQNSYGNDE